MIKKTIKKQIYITWFASKKKCGKLSQQQTPALYRTREKEKPANEE